MISLMKSVVVIGQVFGLVLGNKFTLPADETLTQYRYLRFDV